MQVRKRLSFAMPFYTKTASFYQDRLGTNIGKALKKWSRVFLQDAIDSFACLCAPGYTGNACEIDVDECRSAPCANGGGCAESNLDETVPADAYQCCERHSNDWLSFAPRTK